VHEPQHAVELRASGCRRGQRRGTWQLEATERRRRGLCWCPTPPATAEAPVDWADVWRHAVTDVEVGRRHPSDCCPCSSRATRRSSLQAELHRLTSDNAHTCPAACLLPEKQAGCLKAPLKEATTQTATAGICSGGAGGAARPRRLAPCGNRCGGGGGGGAPGFRRCRGAGGAGGRGRAPRHRRRLFRPLGPPFHKPCPALAPLFSASQATAAAHPARHLNQPPQQLQSAGHQQLSTGVVPPPTRFAPLQGGRRRRTHLRGGRTPRAPGWPRP
jgi:hypothetical protein